MKKEDEIDKSSEPVFIATPSIMELSKGVCLSAKPEKEKQKVMQFLSGLTPLSLDKESSFKAGEIEASLMKRGELIELEDIMIAAIVITNEQTLVTRNDAHFKRNPTTPRHRRGDCSLPSVARVGFLRMQLFWIGLLLPTTGQRPME